MSSEVYEIIVDGREKIAECYTLENATIIARAYFLEWFNQDQLEITIRRIIKDEQISRST